MGGSTIAGSGATTGAGGALTGASRGSEVGCASLNAKRDKKNNAHPTKKLLTFVDPNQFFAEQAFDAEAPDQEIALMNRSRNSRP